LEEWEADGYGREDVEVWIVSDPGELAFVDTCMQGSDLSAFEDDDYDPNGTIKGTVGVVKHNLVVLDREHRVVSVTAVAFDVFFSPDLYRAEIDAAVRSVL
jgi:hypothetical protein